MSLAPPIPSHSGPDIQALACLHVFKVITLVSGGAESRMQRWYHCKIPVRGNLLCTWGLDISSVEAASLEFCGRKRGISDRDYPNGPIW